MHCTLLVIIVEHAMHIMRKLSLSLTAMIDFSGNDINRTVSQHSKFLTAGYM